LYIIPTHCQEGSKLINYNKKNIMAIESKKDLNEIGTSTGGTSLYINEMKGLTELKFRVMGTAKTGFQYFQKVTKEDGTQGVKPVRSEEYPDTLENPGTKYQSEELIDKATEFIVMPIYDFSDGNIKLWNLSKKSVIQSLVAVEADADLGEIQDYGFKLTKTGKGLETSYNLLRLDKSEATQEQKNAFAKVDVNLADYFEGTGGIKTKEENLLEVDPSEIDF
jgi:hypothetical protein